MPNALFLAAIIGPMYLVFGFSLILYVKQWQKISTEYSKNHFALLPNMFAALILGLVIIRMYSIWSWDLYVVITITGWSALIKSIFYFLAPSGWINWVLRSAVYRSEVWLYFWGALMTVIGVLLTYNSCF